jgi:hypothetical protein
MTARIAALAGSLAVLGACSAEPPDVNVATVDAGMGTTMMPPPPDCMAGTVLAPPRIADPMQTTYWPSAKVSGTGTEGGLVLFESGSKRLDVEVRAGGTFCKDLPLQPGMLNRFEARSTDRCGNISTPVVVQIMQQGTPPPGQPGRDPENVALGSAGASIETSMSRVPLEGYTLDMLNDGNPGTYVGFVVVYGEHWLKLRLSDSSRKINRVRMLSPSGCTLPEFHLLVTDRDQPVTPTASPTADWVKVDVRGAGIGTTEETFQFTAVQPTYLALVTDRNSWATLGTCGWSWIADLAISEIEAWTVADRPKPPEQAPTCSSGP